MCVEKKFTRCFRISLTDLWPGFRMTQTQMKSEGHFSARMSLTELQEFSSPCNCCDSRAAGWSPEKSESASNNELPKWRKNSNRASKCCLATERGWGGAERARPVCSDTVVFTAAWQISLLGKELVDRPMCSQQSSQENQNTGGERVAGSALVPPTPPDIPPFRAR